MPRPGTGSSRLTSDNCWGRKLQSLAFGTVAKEGLGLKRQPPKATECTKTLLQLLKFPCYQAGTFAVWEATTNPHTIQGPCSVGSPMRKAAPERPRLALDLRGAPGSWMQIEIVSKRSRSSRRGAGSVAPWLLTDRRSAPRHAKYVAASSSPACILTTRHGGAAGAMKIPHQSFKWQGQVALTHFLRWQFCGAIATSKSCETAICSWSQVAELSGKPSFARPCVRFLCRLSSRPSLPSALQHLLKCAVRHASPHLRRPGCWRTQPCAAVLVAKPRFTTLFEHLATASDSQAWLWASRY